MPQPRSLALLSAAIALASTLSPALAGSLLDATFPRGRDTCYGATRNAVQGGIAMIRMTRPERFRIHDASESRHVRIVINFAGKGKPRHEDSVSCVEDGDQLRCHSASCEGAVFLLEPAAARGVLLRQGGSKAVLVWRCGEDSVRNIDLRDEDRTVTMRRGAGACL